MQKREEKNEQKEKIKMKKEINKKQTFCHQAEFQWSPTLDRYKSTS